VRTPYDVIVVGAGPAGSTAARYAARRGLKVLLLDKRREIGVPVQCGEYVAEDNEVRTIFPTVTDLEDLMVVPHRVKQIDTPLIRIWSPKGRTYDIPFHGYTVQRDKMDQGIADQAVQEGAALVKETPVTRVRGTEVFTPRGTFEGNVIIGADGPRSTVAQSVGLPWPVSAPAMSTTADGSFSNVTDMFFGNLAPGGYAWIIPKGPCANVGLGTWEHFHGNLRVLFDKFLAARDLTPGKPTGGYVPVLGPVERTAKDRAILVGDAAGMVMATNGGGINVSMIAGRIAGMTAADHILGGVPLDAYEHRWRAVLEGPLQHGVQVKKLADRFFGSDRLLEAAMILLGRRRMGRAIRCQRLLWPGVASTL
jgi:digeranylgeranylglycerophospholipid reductase